MLQVTARHILGSAGPVKKNMSPDLIGDLDDAESIDIAGENLETFSKVFFHDAGSRWA
jgi:hypothetical protein